MKWNVTVSFEEEKAGEAELLRDELGYAYGMAAIEFVPQKNADPGTKTEIWVLCRQENFEALKRDLEARLERGEIWEYSVRLYSRS